MDGRMGEGAKAEGGDGEGREGNKGSRQKREQPLHELGLGGVAGAVDEVEVLLVGLREQLPPLSELFSSSVNFLSYYAQCQNAHKRKQTRCLRSLQSFLTSAHCTLSSSTLHSLSEISLFISGSPSFNIPAMLPRISSNISS